MHSINMLSQAGTVKGQGVLSAYEEQVKLVSEGLDEFSVTVNDKRIKAAITHVHTINPTYYLAASRAKKYGATVGYVHFLPETVDTSLRLPWIAKKVFYWYMLKFYNHMDHLVVVNPYFIDKLEEYGVSREKVTYIPNFVSDKEFYPLEKAEKLATRKKYGLAPDKFTVICAGQLQTRKGIFDFVEIAKKMPHMQFAWAGDFSFGNISDGHRDIQKILANPPANLKFVGLIDRSEMNHFFNMGDVMFLPSYEELFPMTILESMNCKIPLLLRDIDLYKNILFDYYLRGNTNEEFINLLNRLEQEPEFYQQAQELSWKGHLFYHKDHVLEMWRTFYTEVVKVHESKSAVAQHSAKEPSIRETKI